MFLLSIIDRVSGKGLPGSDDELCLLCAFHSGPEPNVDTAIGYDLVDGGIILYSRQAAFTRNCLATIQVANTGISRLDHYTAGHLRAWLPLRAKMAAKALYRRWMCGPPIKSSNIPES